MKINKVISLLACAVTALGAASCGSEASSSEKDSSKLKIVCTVFPAYDWVRELTKDAKEKPEITYLLDKGSDMHSFQPTAEDIMKISTCDLFVYVGGESDHWAEDALKGAVNKDMKTVNMLEAIGSDAMTEEIKEGMQAEEEHDDHEGHGHEEAPEYDEHVWLSVRNAKELCGILSEDLCELDSSGAEAYRSAYESYAAKLDELDSDLKALADKAKSKTLIFGDRFPFRYFTADYGFDYYAAFVGCSAETEASFETVAFLAGKIDELGADTVYTLENSDGKLARSIIDSSKSKSAKIAQLDSLQSVSAERIAEGADYISIMKKNYETLKADLS